ncbi:MAG: gfo/Idh/MocA family oxidoreductase [Puniceicoccaceae bacterium]|nr:MAG: gfo/Idh/MocA family oxidoreductase [Puniceicoccaceae bacterium]
MKSLRFGIIGLGNMGSAHAASLKAGKVPRATLAAVCDLNPQRLQPFEDLARYEDPKAFLASGKVDAVIIATPHYAHTTLGIEALKQGLHVMVEKPVSVHKADAEKLIAAYKGREKKQVFAAMFNQRTDPYYIKIRNLIRSGELGTIRRINWIITNWFRTEAYYASGGWRATWGGEGGGVLLNQCPHNLDLFQWMFGMPVRVRATCAIGRYHDIEVEDDVTAYMEYADGSHAVFITSTGEAPGTNRLEITAEQGRVVYEDDRITYRRNVQPMSEFSRTHPGSFARPETWDVTIPAPNHGSQHNGILTNFVDAILDKATLISPAVEGIHSVELGNAMLFSSFLGKTVELPLDAKAYERHLKKLIAGSRYQEKVKKSAKAAPAEDFSKSF